MELLQFVCAAFESLEEQARLQAEMCMPYISKCVAPIRSQDPDWAPDEDCDAAPQGVIDRQCYNLFTFFT